LSPGGDIEKFFRANAYPLVGELTLDNLQFYRDRKLDSFWFGLDPNDTASVDAINQGVQN